MKISKLFHWLYALLMFLPFIFFIGSLLFYIFKGEYTENIVGLFDSQLTNIFNLSLFSWCKTTFLIEPFIYISSLFGIVENSLIISMLSYWLTISIIWLVFDIIMYVPNLAHKWIDKGAIE